MGASTSSSRALWSSTGSNNERPLESQSLVVENPVDGYSIPCRLFTPVDKKSIRAAVLFIHGGMFSRGDCESHPKVSQMLAGRLDLMVLTCSFRDGKHGTSTYSNGKAWSDLMATVEWLAETSDRPIGLVGSSSGGWFALKVLLEVLERKQSKKPIEISFCIPLCPVANPHARAIYLQHCIDGTTPLANGTKDPYAGIRHTPPKAKYILEQQMRYFSNSYKDMAQAGQDILRLSSKSSLPPVLVILAAADRNVPLYTLNDFLVQPWIHRVVVLGGGVGHEIQDIPPIRPDTQSYVDDINLFLEEQVGLPRRQHRWHPLAICGP